MNTFPGRFIQSFFAVATTIAVLFFASPDGGCASTPAFADPGGRVLSKFPQVYVNWNQDSLFLNVDGIGAGEYEIYDLTGPSRIVIEIPGWKSDDSRGVQSEYNFDRIPILNQLRASSNTECTRVVLESRYPLHWEIVSEPEQVGLQILVYIRFRQTMEELAIDDGTVYLARRYVFPEGQRFVHAVVSDPSKSRLRPQVKYAWDVTTRRLASIRDIVDGSWAAAGVNGGYFMWPGISLSLMIQEGDITAPPFLHRPAFMVMQDGSMRIAYPEIRATITSSYSIRWETDVINQSPGYQQIALLTPGHPSRIRAGNYGTKAVINNGIVELVTNDNAEIEDFSNRHVLWSRKEYPPLELLKPGDEVIIRLERKPGSDPMRWAIQGGPFLAYNGRVYITSAENDIGNDIARGRSARTAVGLDNYGRIYLVAVDGPGSGRSMGATLEELAWTMLDLGATTAMNLDGGSSTAMALGFSTPETRLPSGGRLIATALVLIDESGRM
ncbi:MAG TPA: phosphodiester glycosidase family protein, partial [Firmicutes bacterium]|nr:phosphodiester glycosidase family protein [Bacillota bacterium]